MSIARHLGRCLHIHTRSRCPPSQRTAVSAIVRPTYQSFRQKTDLPHQHSLRTVSSTASARAQDPYDGMPKILVFGGNGFIGSRVCEEALSTGLQADVFDLPLWRSQLEGTIGVISCLGAFGGNEFMYKICGESNATVFREAAKAGVARAAFISVADLKLPDAVLRGYFQGKRYAERVLFESFPEGGVALRPSFVFGTRNVGGVGIPLQAVGWPFQKALSYVPQTKDFAQYPVLSLGLIPPSSVKAVAKAAVAAATDPVVPSGPLDSWDINKYDE